MKSQLKYSVFFLILNIFLSICDILCYFIFLVCVCLCVFQIYRLSKCDKMKSFNEYLYHIKQILTASVLNIEI